MSISLPFVAAAYSTKCTHLTTAGTGYEQILDRNPLRYHLLVESFNVGLGNVQVIPASAVRSAIAGGVGNVPYEVEFTKRPAAITGEWYVFSNGATPILITEELQNPV